MTLAVLQKVQGFMYRIILEDSKEENRPDRDSCKITLDLCVTENVC